MGEYDTAGCWGPNVSRRLVLAWGLSVTWPGAGSAFHICCMVLATRNVFRGGSV